MLDFLAAAILASTMSGSPAAPLAWDPLEDWVIDNATARVVKNDAFERSPDDDILGDRILFDLRQRVGEERGTLVVSCLQERFKVYVEGKHLLREGSTADWPLAAKLVQNYCGLIDHLPAGLLTPI